MHNINNIDFDAIFYAENNAGKGFSVGVEQDDINNIKGIGELVQESHTNDKVAVYQEGNVYTVVGDCNGPWAVQVLI